MKKHLPLLLLLSFITINGQKRTNSGPKSNSLLYIMNAEEKNWYIRNTDQWMASAKTLPQCFKKAILYTTYSFYTTGLNNTGRSETLSLPSLFKLPVIFGCYILSVFLTIIPASFTVNQSLFSSSYQHKSCLNINN